MFYLLKIFIYVLIIGLFLYSKLLPYREKLNAQYKGIFNFFNTIFSPILSGLKSIVGTFQVGVGLSVDMTQVVLLVLLLIISNLFR